MPKQDVEIPIDKQAASAPEHTSPTENKEGEAELDAVRPEQEVEIPNDQKAASLLSSGLSVCDSNW